MRWQPVNLAALGERPQVTPSIGDVGLVYPGKRHIFSGPPESAKTLAAYCVAISELRAGGRVILIDFEMGQWDARDRLRDLSATDDELAAIHYYEPDAPADQETIDALLQLQPTLVVIDAAAGAYDIEGLDDNKRQDVELFARTFVRPFWANGVATILLDHVTKNSETRGRFTIGSERKTGAADVHLGFETIAPLRRGGRGLYRIVTHKDRQGHLPRPRAAELELVSDPDTHAIAWTFKPAGDDEPATATTGAAGFKPTVLMDRVLELLAAQQEPVSRKYVTDNVKGMRREWKLRAIDELVAEGRIHEAPGPRGAKLLTLSPVPGSHLFPLVPGTREGGDLFPPPSLQGEQVPEQVTGTSHEAHP